MKCIYTLILLLLIVSSAYSSEMLSLTIAPKRTSPLGELSTDSSNANSLQAKLDSLIKDSTNFESVSKLNSNPKILSKINAAKADINKQITICRLLQLNMETDLGGKYIKEITDMISAPSLRIASDIQLRPAGNDNGDFLSPVVAADYKNRFINSKKSFVGEYDFLLSIQPPSTASDTDKVVSRILSTGADGVFQTGTKFGFIGSQCASLIGFNAKLNWLNSRSVKNENLSSFAFLSFSHLYMAKLGPVVFAYEQEFRFANSKSRENLSARINKAMSGNLIVGINLDTVQMQLKYLMNSNNAIASDERLEISFGTALDILK
jgi:hypothetical protein